MRLGPEPRIITLRRSVGVDLVLVAEGRVEVGRLGRELGGAGVDPLEDAADAGAPRAPRTAASLALEQLGEARVGEPGLPCARRSSSAGTESSVPAGELRLELDDLADLAQEPGVDGGHRRPPRPPSSPGAGPRRPRRGAPSWASPAAAAAAPDRTSPLLARPAAPSSSSDGEPLQQRLAGRCAPIAITSPTDFIAVPSVRRRAGELLEGPARDLHHRVVERRLEGRVGLAGDVVGDLVEGVADGEQGGDLGDREAGRLARPAPSCARRAGSSR